MIESGKTYYVAFAQFTAYGFWKGVDITFPKYKVVKIENNFCYVINDHDVSLIYSMAYTESRFGTTKEEAVKKAIKELKETIEHKQTLIDTLEAWKDN